MTTKRRGRTIRGSIMILTLFILSLLAMMGTGFMLLVPVEMRNAKQDREIMQTGLGADAALKIVLDELYHDIPYQDIALNSPEVMSGNWKYQVENIDEIEDGVYRVTTAGLLGDKVKRRAVAVVDDGSGKFAISFTSGTTDGSQEINSQGAWPVNVPIQGDIYVQGTWYVDNTGLDLNEPNADRPFKGFIFQTDPSGEGLRGERYEGTIPTNATQYAAMYDYGIDAIQAYDPAKITEDDLFLTGPVNDRVLRLAFGVDTDSQVSQQMGQVSGIVHAGDPDNDGVLEGGFYIPSDANIEYSFNPVSNVGTTKIQTGSGTIILTSQKGVNSETTPDTPDTINLTAPGITENYKCNLEKGYLLYVDGEVTSVKGTYLGNQTVAAARGLTITGELLKSDTPRGQEPDGSTDALGLIACVNAGSNDPGMSVDMASIPSDKEYYVYAYLTSLSHNDSAAKMFSRSQHPSLPSGTTFTLIGAIAWAPTTAGQINTGMEYIASSWKEVIIDSNRPLGFPSGGKYIPRVRSYVDVPVGE